MEEPRGDGVHLDADDAAANTVGHVRGSGVSVSKRALTQVVEHPSFTKIRAKTAKLLKKGFTQLSERKVYILLNELLCQDGSLIFIQVMTSAPHLRMSHDFLNTVYGLAPAMTNYLGFGLTMSKDMKRRGRSEDFALSPNINIRWNKGEFQKINFYRDVALPVKQSISGATSMVAGDEMDFWFDDAKFIATGNALYRLLTSVIG